MAPGCYAARMPPRISAPSARQAGRNNSTVETSRISSSNNEILDFRSRLPLSPIRGPNSRKEFHPETGKAYALPAKSGVAYSGSGSRGTTFGRVRRHWVRKDSRTQLSSARRAMPPLQLVSAARVLRAPLRRRPRQHRKRSPEMAVRVLNTEPLSCCLQGVTKSLRRIPQTDPAKTLLILRNPNQLPKQQHPLEPGILLLAEWGRIVQRD